jgi:hypothetical protein
MLNALINYGRTSVETIKNHLNDHEKGRTLGVITALSAVAFKCIFIQEDTPFSKSSPSQVIAKTIGISIAIFGIAIWMRAVLIPPAFLREFQRQSPH